MKRRPTPQRLSAARWIVRPLLAACAVVVLAASFPESPVADAAMRGQWDDVRAMIREGADVTIPQGDGIGQPGAGTQASPPSSSKQAPTPRPSPATETTHRCIWPARWGASASSKTCSPQESIRTFARRAAGQRLCISRLRLAVRQP